MKKNIKKLLLLLVTVIFLYFVFVNLDFKELISTMKSFKPIYALFLSLCIFCPFLFRSLCFKVLMSNSAKLPIKELVPLCMTAAIINITVPARAGDVFRAFFIGQKYKIDKLKVFGAVMFERIFDTLSIVLMLFIAVSFYHKTPLAQNMCLIGGGLLFLMLLLTVYAYKYNKTDAICSFLTKKTKSFPFSEYIHKFINFVNTSLNSLFKGFEVIGTPSKLPFIILFNILNWCFECLNFYIIVRGFGYDTHWSVCLFINSFIAFACMVPSTSIFIGPYQVAVIAAFAIYNISKESALAISFVEQGFVVILTTIVAAIFLIRNNISYKELKEDIEQNEA